MSPQSKRKIPLMRKKIYHAIRKFWEEDGLPPTYRDIAEKVGTIVSNAYFHVMQLRDEEMIEYKQLGRWRGIAPVGMQITMPDVPEEYQLDECEYEYEYEYK